VVEEKLTADRAHRLKAVCVVHNETSTGVASRIPEIREAIDRARHPALLMVDTVSSLASIDYRHDAWKVDVTVAGSQKGLMLPPGLGFNAVSKNALTMSKTARLPRSYWDWEAMLDTGRTGFFPYTPATNLLFGLRESLRMLLDEEGLPAVLHRHARHAEATRRAAAGWGLEVLCADPREHSNSLTAILVPAGFDADRLREIILEAFDMSLGTGLGRLKGKVFRISHLAPRGLEALFPAGPPGDRLDQLADAVHDEGDLRAVPAAAPRSRHRHRNGRLLLLQPGPGNGPRRFPGPASAPHPERRPGKADQALGRPLPPPPRRAPCNGCGVVGRKRGASRHSAGSGCGAPAGHSRPASPRRTKFPVFPVEPGILFDIPRKPAVWSQKLYAESSPCRQIPVAA
jgi:hypothetical protein